MAARIIRIAAASVLAAALIPALARADGDPASDVLLGQNVFYPYSSPVSASLQRTLNSETTAASRAHFPIKVALIGSTADLGVITSLFAKPQKYADFLDQEISFNGKEPLLVVMPTGYGVQGLSTAATAAAASLTKPTARQGNDLARAAIAAVPKLAAAAGHPIADISDTSTTTTGHSSRTLILAILVVASGATAVALIVIRRRHAQAR